MDNQSSYQESNIETPPPLDWKSRLTTVTTFSKWLATILFVLLPFVGAYIGWQFREAKTLYDEGTEVTAGDEMNSAIGPVEAARQVAEKFLPKHVPEGLEFDLEFIKQKGDWISFRVVPRNMKIDEAQIILERNDESWVVLDLGTAFPDLYERNPSFFESDTSNWQTYRNEEYGFEFQYPQTSSINTRIREAGSYLELSDINNANLSIEISQAESATTTTSMWAEYQNWPFPGHWSEHFTITEIDGVQAIEKPETGSVTVKISTLLLHITNGIGREDAVGYSSEVLTAILETFNFLEPEIDISNWQTYRNEEYGFSFRYPKLPDFKVDTSNEGRAQFILSSLSDVATEGPQLQVSIDKNPEDLQMEEFYTNSNQVNYFEQTSPEDITERTIGPDQISATQFIPYVTLAGDVIVVISREGYFISICDCGMFFSSNDLFERILASFEFKEPGAN